MLNIYNLHVKLIFYCITYTVTFQATAFIKITTIIQQFLRSEHDGTKESFFKEF